MARVPDRLELLLPGGAVLTGVKRLLELPLLTAEGSIDAVTLEIGSGPAPQPRSGPYVDGGS